ncbi:hypothetical protein G6F65_022752 [Rhizopus arrhizus]|nr:hypothetical protein G6F65_022752 [Rhizopus arrhizus]
MLVQVTLQVAGLGMQPLVQRLRRIGHGVQLGAVAGGQQHCLGDLRGIAQRTERARQRLTGEGRALAQLYRCGLVIQSEHPQGHCPDAADARIDSHPQCSAAVPGLRPGPGGGAGQGPRTGRGH